MLGQKDRDRQSDVDTIRIGRWISLDTVRLDQERPKCTVICQHIGLNPRASNQRYIGKTR